MALRIITGYELLMSPLRKAVDGSHSGSTHYCRVRSVIPYRSRLHRGRRTFKEVYLRRPIILGYLETQNRL